VKQKLSCFVDETGQDDRSKHFIVVAVVCAGDREALEAVIVDIEQHTKVGNKKWHKLRSPEREAFLEFLVNAQLPAGEVFFGKYAKPLPFFLPMLETLIKAITAAAAADYQAVVYVDGIDKKKARELTNALRLKGIKAQHVRSARDESEPLIRLADRWAGCIRGSLEGNAAAETLVTRAIDIACLKEV
jgi:hypothetical protein